MNSLPDDLGQRLRDSVNRGTAPELSRDVVTGAGERDAPKLTNPRRRIQLAGGATVLVAVIAVGALVIAPSLSTAPLFTEAASRGASAGSASANVPAVGGLIRIWANYRYHAGAQLSTSAGSGDVYQLTRVGSGIDRITGLAAAFGLAGDAVTTQDSDPANPVFTMGTVDGVTPALYLTWSGTGDWSYSNQSADPNIACPPIVGSGGESSGSTNGSAGGTTTPIPGPVRTAPVCVGATQPSGPDNAPVGADARARAQLIFAKTGLDVSANDIQLESDPSQTTATANLTVGGVKTALDWSVTWSSTGKISQAYGHSVSIVDRGRFDTVSASDAVQRLGDSRWYGTAGPAYQGGIRPFAVIGSGTASGVANGTSASPGAVGSTPPVATPTGVPTESPTEAPTVEPTAVPTAVPTEPSTPAPTVAPTPEPTPSGPPTIDVTITDAEPTLLLMWASDGDAWLVPGYAMRVENGWWSSVVALVPGIIALPPVPTVVPDIVPPSPVTPETGSGSGSGTGTVVP